MGALRPFFLTLAVSFLVLVSAQGDMTDLGISEPSFMCPSVANPSILVTCNTASDQPTADCIGKCCVSTGLCQSTLCSESLGLKDNDCFAGAYCPVYQPCHLMNAASCTLNGGTNCLGKIHCTNGDCHGYTEGDYCITRPLGVWKVCHGPASSSSTGPSGFIVGDPQFVGLRGQSYQVHGVAGEVYNIVSDTDLQYNSRFVFLDQGDCPVVNGKKQKGCFAHPGSYLGELGLKTRFGDQIHYVSGAAASGFAVVEVNGRQMNVGDMVKLAGDVGFVAFNNSHLSTIHVGNWQFDFENSDMFVNQRVAVTNPSRIRSHGLLGQTWKQVTYPNQLKFVEGAIDDYVIREGDVFGDQFMYNTFN